MSNHQAHLEIASAPYPGPMGGGLAALALGLIALGLGLGGCGGGGGVATTGGSAAGTQAGRVAALDQGAAGGAPSPAYVAHLLNQLAKGEKTIDDLSLEDRRVVCAALNGEKKRRD